MQIPVSCAETHACNRETSVRADLHTQPTSTHLLFLSDMFIYPLMTLLLSSLPHWILLSAPAFSLNTGQDASQNTGEPAWHSLCSNGGGSWLPVPLRTMMNWAAMIPRYLTEVPQEFPGSLPLYLPTGSSFLNPTPLVPLHSQNRTEWI